MKRRDMAREMARSYARSFAAAMIAIIVAPLALVVIPPLGLLAAIRASR